MKKNKLINIYNNLFYPINNKDYGYWKVSNNKSKPLANAEELLKYVQKKEYNGTFINRYANLENDLILENNIFLDFDLKDKTYLKKEKALTDDILKGLVKKSITINEKENNHHKNSKINLKQVQRKFKKDFTIENGYTKGFNSFIDGLTEAEAKALKKEVSNEQGKEIKGKKEKDIQQYYINTFEKYYLEEPFKEATTVAKYFESIGIKTVLNWSGSKGLHLRIPITNIDFVGTDLEDNNENVKIFLKNLAELIETKLLKKTKETSSLDYQVFSKGIQRIPTSQHNKTKLYANFIDPSFNYLEAIDYLAINPITDIDKLDYFPEEIDTEKNTTTFLESDIYKATIKKAVEETNLQTYSSEVGNVAYNFKSEDHKKLKEMILEIYPESVNFFPYKVIHLLKRTGFSKEEVEAIFRDVEPNEHKYNMNIKGNIKYTFENPNAKICGLKNLIEWIENKYPNHEKDNVINYFKTNFEYYEKPIKEEKVGTAIFKDNKDKEIEVPIYLYETKYKKYLKYQGILEGIDLTLDFSDKIGYFIYTNTGKTIDSFEFTFKNNFFKITNFKDLKEFLESEGISIVNNFDKYLRRSLSNLDKSITKPKIIEESIVKADVPDSIVFGVTEESYYQQTEKGIEHIKPTQTGYKSKPIANVVIKDVTIILDSLDILEPVYNITYYNKTFNKEVTVEHLTKKQLTEEFDTANVFYNSYKGNIDNILHSFIIDGTKEERIEVRVEAYLEGFYIVNGKVVENTKLKNLKPYTSEDVAEAINLLNEIMKDRTAEGKANDSTVYRFSLWNPFSYCLKQIGFVIGIYSLILIGKTKGNKTGAIKIGKLFYLNTEESNSGSTVSVLGSKLEENSFSKPFDESYHLLNQPEIFDVMKKATQELITRITKDRNDNKKNDEFNAIGLPSFLLNERMEFPDYIRERYKITDYTNKSYVSKKDRVKFNKKYLPDDTENTVLRKLAIIGNEFKKKIIPLIEGKDKRLLKPEELTIEILRDIAKETSIATGKPIDFLSEMYTITEPSKKYDYDVAEAIRNFLNKEFKKHNKIGGQRVYYSSHMVSSIKNNDFPSITYDKDNERFIFNASKFEKYINNHIEETTVELEEILDYLDLTETLNDRYEEYKKKAESDKRMKNKIKTFEEYIRKKQYLVKGKNISGFYLTTMEVMNNVFGLDYESSDEDDNKDIENKK